jgi:hypothetical protein
MPRQGAQEKHRTDECSHPQRGPRAGTVDPDCLGQDLPEAERSIEVGRHEENRTRRPRGR